MHGIGENTDPAPLLHTALTSIGRRVDANNVQKDFYKAMHGKQSNKRAATYHKIKGFLNFQWLYILWPFENDVVIYLHSCH